ncbi:MAG TPA: MBL fold metallo-hydrolase [Spirochaetota bacterium]|nr:MBL fold metallo-hydrolase [Spirochaetota bacterium]
MAERCELTIVVDNYVDIFLQSTKRVNYPVAGPYSKLWAEQGLSIFIEVFEKDKIIRMLYDFGRSSEIIQHNLKILGIDIGLLDYLILSHGHVDHFGGLEKILQESNEKCKLILDPEAYGRKRYIKIGEEKYAGPWEISKDLVQCYSKKIIDTVESVDLGNGVIISARIPRTVSFESGMENAYVDDGKGLVHDDILDDRAVFINIIGCGILVITGCCHSGIINTILEAEREFPEENHIYAILGGLHLNKANSLVMGNTISELKKRNINCLSTFHCTGFYANQQLMEAFGDAWSPGCVGAKFVFENI